MNKIPFERKQKGIVVALFIVCTLFLAAGSFSSCSKKEEEPASLIGKWKLEKLEGGHTSTPSLDCSQKNIIYEFHSNGVLTVIEEFDDILYGICDPGEYLYKVVEDEGYLEIDSRKYFFNISSKRMKIESAEYLDLPCYIFKKN